MQNFQMSNLHCLVCNVQFNPSDVGVLEPDDLLVCDLCAYSLYEFKVKYDGSEDLLAYLKTEVSGRRCMSCLEPALLLERIKYGKPVEGFVNCKECSKENKVNIHIEFV